ncbi:tyrosine-type recombinase/integrase [Streptomyces sp. NPDC002619]|uniref:tyrosine-type recombinase/integrase n=1 Tax=Streptomyces sp. NPDC002619 TaxID=3364655 RepID=UPI0036C08DDF
MLPPAHQEIDFPISFRVKTERHGNGLRYRARYIGPDGTEKSKSFPDRQKRLAEHWLTQTAADMAQGTHVDARAARTTFQQYAETWLASLAMDINGHDSAERRLRLHVFPYIGTRPLVSFQPGHIRTWLGELAGAVPNASYRRTIFGLASSVFAAAVDDALVPRNPCLARSVRSPQPEPSRVVPWTLQQVFTVRSALPERFRAMIDVGVGCGLRQGEIFGLPVDAVDFDSGWLGVRTQVKRVRGKFVFAPPKRGKIRDVPLPGSVAHALREHMTDFSPVEITLPWQKPDGPLVTRRLIFTGRTGDSVRASYFDDHLWKPALVTAGLIPEPKPGERHASAREHGMHALRHFYDSVLLDAGENIRALSTYLGHSDPGFTLRVYTHLMPSSEGRTRKAVDAVLTMSRS